MNDVVDNITKYTRADWFALFCEIFSNLENNGTLSKYCVDVHSALSDARNLITLKNRYEKEDCTVE